MGLALSPLPTGPLLAEALEAALEILRLLAFARVAHEVERGGVADLIDVERYRTPSIREKGTKTRCKTDLPAIIPRLSGDSLILIRDIFPMIRGKRRLILIIYEMSGAFRV
jgi:hypothetical protein